MLYKILSLFFFLSLSVSTFAVTEQPSHSLGDIPITQIIQKYKLHYIWNSYEQTLTLYQTWFTVNLSTYNNMLIINGENIVYLDQAPLLNSKGVMEISSKTYAELSQIWDNYFNGVFNNVSTIVIDPGHGGVDSGTYTFKKGVKISEKNIVLKIGLMVYHRLKKQYPYKNIIITRTKDQSMTLQDRVNIANSFYPKPPNHMLFIAIHVNAMPMSRRGKVSGFQIFYATKNSHRVLTNPKKYTSVGVFKVVNDLLNSEYLTESHNLATNINNAMKQGLHHQMQDLPMRQMDFFVVKHSRMASILIETGFIGNHHDFQLLTNTSYLNLLSKSICNGIATYIQGEKHGS